MATPEILLSSPKPVNPLEIFMGARERVQDRRTARQADKLALQEAERQADQAAQQQERKSVAEFSLQLKPFLDSGDIEGAIRFTEGRDQALRSGRRNNEHTAETLNDLRAGNIDIVKQDVGNTLTFAERTGLIKPGTRAKPVALSPGQVLVDPSTGREITKVEKPEDTKAADSKIKDLRIRHDKFSGDLRKVDAAFEKVQSAPESAAGDIALIFNYMKMLDPGSTVREGEFATAQNAGGVDQRVWNTYNRLLSGERLNPQQRSDFKNVAKSAFDAQQASADKQTSLLLSQADQDGIPRVKVLGEQALKAFQERAAEREAQRNRPQGVEAMEGFSDLTPEEQEELRQREAAQRGNR